MKKQLLTVITLVVLSVSCASAQAVWGIRVGASKPMISIKGDGGSLNWSGKFGIEAGPVLYYNLKNNFYINSGLLFSLKTFDLSGSDYTDKLNMYYLTLPVYVGYHIPIGKLSTYLQAGPYISYKLSGKEDYSDADVTETLDVDFLQSIDAGLGIMYGININKFKIEVGYQYGLTNLLKNTEDYDFTGIKARASSLFLGISYVF